MKDNRQKKGNIKQLFFAIFTSNNNCNYYYTIFA